MAETEFIRKLLQQVETLDEPVRRPVRRSRRPLLVAIAVGVAAAAVFTGVTVGADSASHRPEPVTEFASSLSARPTPYPTNDRGQTYGDAQDGVEADLQSVISTHGKNGYCWKSDLEGPHPMTPEEAVWLTAVRTRREVAVYEADGVTQVGVYVVGGGGSSGTDINGTTVTRQSSDRIAQQPPAWFYRKMEDLAARAGDAYAWAWWTRTTAAKAASATGEDAVAAGDPTRSVYLAIILGDFTSWLWSLPEGETAPQYSWISMVIDTDTRALEASSGSARPPGAATELPLNIVGLRDPVRLSQ